MPGSTWEYPPWRSHSGRGRRYAPVFRSVLSLVLQLPVLFWSLHATPALLGLGLAAAVVASGGLLLSRRAPGPCVVLVGAASMVGLVLIEGPPVSLIPFLFAVVSGTVRGARAWVLATVGAMLVLPVWWFVVASDPFRAVRSLATVVVLLMAAAAGEWLRVARLRMVDRRAVWAERNRAIAEEERVRIARELHDVLAHSLSSITVQAGVGLHLADTRPSAAVEALTGIRATSKQALDEVRSVLGVLRPDEHAPTRPTQNLDDLPALVTEASGLGIAARLDDRLQPRPPDAVQLALYRIVQESLTNAGRHAPGSTVVVTLTNDGETVVATIRDRGGAAGPPTTGSGRGIEGMRERAALLGGTLAVDRHDDGIEVVARLPRATPVMT